MQVGLTIDRLFYQTLIRAPQRKVIYKDRSRTYKELFDDVVTSQEVSLKDTTRVQESPCWTGTRFRIYSSSSLFPAQEM